MRWLILGLILYLIYENGLVSVIDGLQLFEVLTTAFVLSVIKRGISRHKQGLCAIMETTSIISGVVWTILNLLFMFFSYKRLEKIMLDISLISFVYGVIFSILNTFLIKIYKRSIMREHVTKH